MDGAEPAHCPDLAEGLAQICPSNPLAIDGMTDIREEAHQYSIRNVFPRVGETGSTKEIISLLERLLEERNAVS
jgi:hypothetical protein